MSEKFSHIDDKGNAKMVDVGEKNIQKRIAKAKGKITLNPNTVSLIEQNLLKKDDVLTVAKIAGIQAAKKTPDFIPLCHTLMLSKVEITFNLTNDSVIAESEVKCEGKTGVEMEALTAVSVALLTIYDMCKAVDKNMIISYIELISKEKKDI